MRIQAIAAVTQAVSSPASGFREMGFLNQAQSLVGLHSDVHRLMGRKDRDWLFHWQDMGNGRQFVIIRGRGLPDGLSVPLRIPRAGVTVPFTLRVRAVRRSEWLAGGEAPAGCEGNANRCERLIAPNDIGRWLQDHMPGLDLLDMEKPDFCSHGFGKSGLKMISGYLVRGSCRIADQSQVGDLMTTGIGRMRGYGFGMLMLGNPGG